MDVFKKALGRKLGPLPMWAWFLAAGFGWWFYQSRKAAQQAAAGPTPVQITPGVVTNPPAGAGDSGGGGGAPPPQPPPQPPPSPPPVQGGGITIWIHGNPGRTFLYTGDPNVAAWFQVGGQWYYYEPVATPKYQGQAFAQNDPELPPGAGQPPGNAGPASQSVGGQTVQSLAKVATVHTGGKQPTPPAGHRLSKVPTGNAVPATTGAGTPPRHVRRRVPAKVTVGPPPPVSHEPRIATTQGARKAAQPAVVHGQVHMPPRPRTAPQTPPVAPTRPTAMQSAAHSQAAQAQATAQARTAAEKTAPNPPQARRSTRSTSPPFRHPA